MLCTGELPPQNRTAHLGCSHFTDGETEAQRCDALYHIPCERKCLDFILSQTSTVSHSVGWCAPVLGKQTLISGHNGPGLPRLSLYPSSELWARGQPLYGQMSQGQTPCQYLHGHHMVGRTQPSTATSPPVSKRSPPRN